MSLLYLVFFLVCCNSFREKQISAGNSRWLSPLAMSGGSSKEPLVLEGLPLLLERRSRPPHPQFARRKMQLNFAVQLMRQSYAAVDKLGFVPTDEFQKSFFLYRQSEWEDWRDYYPGIMQGDLSEALYFDHVSFCQYAVIADKMRRGKQAFVQLVDANGTAESVQRDPLLINNDLLPGAHSALVGDAVLDWIISTYSNIVPNDLPFSNQTALYRPKRKIDSEAAFQQFRREAQDILDVFEVNAYALGIRVEPLPTAATAPAAAGPQLLLSLRLVGPANLWSSQVLRKRGDQPINDFEVKVLQSLARRRGLTLQLVSSTVINESEVLHVVKLV